jgi:hypothetical protein
MATHRNLLQALGGLAFGLLQKKNTTASFPPRNLLFLTILTILSFPVVYQSSIFVSFKPYLNQPQQWQLLLFSPEHHQPLTFPKPNFPGSGQDGLLHLYSPPWPPVFHHRSQHSIIITLLFWGNPPRCYPKTIC